uniref:Phosphatase n=1 Tax=uncultured Bacillota bacterium TaxID=344338 RepID=A0A650EN14_9FIRM|nr:phosphatase [uncultured Firmicutes bacterium]
MQHIIFDMDGVLINSEPLIMHAAQTALAEYGITATRKDFEPFLGAGEEKFIISPAAQAGKSEDIPAICERMYRLYEERAAKELIVYPSALPLLRQLKEREILTALASSSARRKLMVSLEAAGIAQDLFRVILSGSDVKEKKPSPEIYLTAAQKLGAHPQDCLVIEDALSGITAAKAAGMQCFAVTTSFEKKQLKQAGADIIADDIIRLLDLIF